MHDETADWRRWGARLCHPLPLAAVLLMTVNDHVLKGSGVVPSALAGKLSDLAGLFFFPLLLAAGFALLLRVAGVSASERAVGRTALLATGLVFAGLKLSPGFNLAVERLWAPNTLDPSDLLALPMLGLSWAWMRRRERPRRLPAEVIAVVVAGLASVATQFSRIERVSAWSRSQSMDPRLTGSRPRKIFSATVIAGTRVNSWYTMEIPSRTAA